MKNNLGAGVRSAFGSNADDMKRSLFTYPFRFDLQRFAGLSDFARDSGGAYLIQSAADLQNLAAFVNADTSNTCKGLTFKLTSDIDMSSVANFTGIGDRADMYQFKGTFDGGNFKISNLKIDSSNSNDRKCQARRCKRHGRLFRRQSRRRKLRHRQKLLHHRQQLRHRHHSLSNRRVCRRFCRNELRQS